MRAMQKDGAAKLLAARPQIMAEDDDDVIEMIFPPHNLVARCEGQSYGPVIGWAHRIIAPAHERVERPHRDPRPRTRPAIRPVEAKEQRPGPRGCRAIAFPLGSTNTRCTDRAGNVQAANPQQALDRTAGAPMRCLFHDNKPQHRC